jgi:hypothetical protein
MFSRDVIRTGLLSTSFAFGSMGFSNEAMALDPQLDTNFNTVHADLMPEKDYALTFSRGPVEFSGELKSVEAPRYDGPILWDAERAFDFKEDVGATAALALIFGVLGAGIGSNGQFENQKPGARIGGGAGLLIAAYLCAFEFKITVLEFDTTVQSISTSAYEWQRGEKTLAETSSYHGQLMTIPESSIPLAVNNEKTQLSEGQKIKAKFYINSHKRIICWEAVPLEK